MGTDEKDRLGSPSEVDPGPLPAAYFLTFRCYGTWLHGDPRGSIDRAHNAPDTPLQDPNARREKHERALLRNPPVILRHAEREMIAGANREHCEHRYWHLWTLNVRSNHVHVVVSAPATPENVMTSLKSWSTRKLVEAGMVVRGAKVWSRHGSTKYLWEDEAIGEAWEYVVHGQGDDVPD